MGQLVRMLAIGLLLIGALLTLHERLGNAQDSEFTTDFLNNPANIALGKQLWAKRCQFCHGKAAYPGSAPPLQPWKYKPEFIFDRITNGFRAMPPLQAEFSAEERKAIVAYVLSRNFSP
jgi:mono/diheme cytochrome c family protein